MFLKPKPKPNPLRIVRKLPIITLEMAVTDKGDYYEYYYKAVNDKGVLTTRKIELHGCGKLYICGVVTKNKGLRHAYGIPMLFTSFDRLRYEYRINELYSGRTTMPYAMAIAEEHKNGFTEWLGGFGNKW